jgi:hypothetical protein
VAETDDEHPPHDVAWLLAGIPEEQRAKALKRLEEEDTVPRYKRTVEGQLTPEQRAMSERVRQHADGLAPSPMLRVRSYTVCDGSDPAAAEEPTVEDVRASLTPDVRAEFDRLRVKLGFIDEGELDPVELALCEAGVAVHEAVADDPHQEEHLAYLRKLLGLKEDEP